MELRDEITLKVGQNFKCLGEDLASRANVQLFIIIAKPWTHQTIFSVLVLIC